MHKTAKFLGLLVALVALSFGAQAREVVPIIEHRDIPVTTATGNPITADQVRSAITAAATARKWQVTRSPSQDLLTATLSWGGKHTIAVSIPYSVEKYSIKYQNSIEMKYVLSEAAPEGSTDLSKLNAPTVNIPAGTPMIHPRYNDLVRTLLQSIQAELRKL